MGLLCGVFSFGQSFCDDQLRQIDFVLQQVRNDLLRIAVASWLVFLRVDRWRKHLRFCTLDVSLFEHKIQTGLNNGDHHSTIVSSYGLQHNRQLESSTTLAVA